MREQYCGAPFEDGFLFDVVLLSNVIDKLRCGKVAGLDCSSAEHSIHYHPILSCILAKLFNIMLRCSYLPVDFGLTYNVPLPKVSD